MIRLLAEGFVFPEAPTWFDGALWVSDVMEGGVTGLSASGAVVDRRVDGRRGIGGMAVTTDGRLVASGRDIVDTATGRTVLARPDGSTGLNDIGTTADGSLLMGVLNHRPLAGDPPVPGSIGRWLDAEVDWVWASDFVWPNGIGGLADGSAVVADYASGELRRIAPHGSRGDSVICRSPSGHYDGLAVDDEDAIWLATGPGGSIERRSPTGELLSTIALPAAFVTSLCFSGDGAGTLLVTVSECELAADGAGAVLAVEVPTPGRAPAPARLRAGG